MFCDPRSIAAAAALLVPIAVSGCSSAPRVDYLSSEAVRGLPFSEAVRVDDMLYLSGMIGIAAGGKLVEGGTAAETEQIMRNIRATLQRHGSSMNDVVKCTVMMADISEWQEMNAVYVRYFEGPLPARSAFGASGLALGARLEIECWASVGAS